MTIATNLNEELIQKYREVNYKRIRRLMNALELRSKKRVKKYKSYKDEVGKIAPNILNRCFDTTSINQKYVSYITEFKVAGTKVCLSPLVDIHTSEILSYTYGLSSNVDLVIEILKKGTVIKLSEMEYKLLECLATNPNQDLSRQQIEKLVWGNNISEFDLKVIDGHILHLRGKLNTDIIKTIRGIGYCLRI